jgi:hypothetical protein
MSENLGNTKLRQNSLVETAILQNRIAAKPLVKKQEEKQSRCINYDKNTEIFSRIQQMLKIHSENREQMLRSSIENNEMLQILKLKQNTQM